MVQNKCLKCYWKGYENCCVAYKPDFDCSKYFEPIDHYCYKWLTEYCGIPKELLIKKGRFYEWKEKIE